MMQSVNSNTAAAAAAAQSQQRAVALQQQQLMRAAAQQAAAQQAAAYAHAASLHQQQQQQLQREKVFNGKLTQIKEFPMDRSHQPPYKLQKALIDQVILLSELCNLSSFFQLSTTEYQINLCTNLIPIFFVPIENCSLHQRSSLRLSRLDDDSSGLCPALLSGSDHRKSPPNAARHSECCPLQRK